jgi:hypothetical protein
VAKHPLVDVSLTSNGTDLSDHLLSISYQLGIGGGPGAAMSELQDYNIPSTRSVSPITANFFQDFAAKCGRRTSRSGRTDRRSRSS